MKFKIWMVVVASLFVQAALAQEQKTSSALLVIGSSYSEGKTPFNNGVAPLGGLSVGFGSYLSLGHALTREKKLNGFLINEAQAGATTFARPACPPGAATCGPAGWDSLQTQLERALARVALPPTFAQYNAKYVVITAVNDCLHSDAFGIPQGMTTPCTPQQLNQVVDRLIALGSLALAKGVTPIYDVYPRYQDLDFNLFQSLFGFSWVINEHDYGLLRSLAKTRIPAELPGAVVLDMWKDFVHLGDGIHPNPATAENAARLIAKKLQELN